MKRGLILLVLVLIIAFLSLVLVFAQTCTDSDGNNYYIKGTASDENSSFADRCVDGKILNEALCGGEIASETTYSCPDGCSDGACLCPTTKCADGAVYGPEKCSVKENVCVCPSCPAVRPTEICTIPTCDGAKDTGNREENNCPIYSCPATPVPTCTDSDGGINYYEKGKTIGTHRIDGHIEHIDICETNTLLFEAYCSGDNPLIEYDRYVCPNGCKDGACLKGEQITEKVFCGFKNSDVEQKCYTAYINDRAYCSGIGNCAAEIKGQRGEQITWKSSCGGYQYTTMDGNDEKVEFDCKVGETTVTEIKNKGFRYAYFQCYDGAESKSTDREACKSAEFWKKFAVNFCESHCKKYEKEEIEKCGVNSFSIGEECYTEETISIPVATTIPVETTTTISPVAECKNDEDCFKRKCKEDEKCYGAENKKCVEGKCAPIIEEEPILICKDSCPLEGKCYPFGYRKSDKYCSDEGMFIEQLSGEETCDNNFECSSNVCVSDKCVSEGFIQKIMKWFKRMFGGD